MKRFPLLAGLAALVGLQAGCLGLESGFGLSLQKSVFASGEAVAEEATVTGGGGSISVSGLIVAELPCDPLDGNVEENGSRLTVTITAQLNRQICQAPRPTTFQYLASVVNVDPGRRTVRVRHRRSGQSAVTILEEEVEVR